MEPLNELCDLIVQNPSQFTSKFSWICSRCPQTRARSHSNASIKVTRSQLNAVLAISRFISKCPNEEAELRPKSLVLEFLKSIPFSFRSSFWPQSYNIQSITSFYSDLLSYVVKACELCKEFGDEVRELFGGILISAITASGDEALISRVFVTCVSKYCPPILQEDAEKLVGYLLEQFVFVNPNSPREMMHSSGVVVNGGSTVSRITFKQQVAFFEEESIESLEKNVIALRILGNMAEKISMKTGDLEQVRLVAKKQLQTSVIFLKIRKRDWTEQGASLKARTNAKLSVYQAAALVQVKCLASLDLNTESSKKLVLETLALFIDAAESCLYSTWRTLRICEDLFSSLLSGISEVSVSRGSQLLRSLLIRFKPLVLTTCALPGTGSNSQGAIFESVTNTVCDIIKSGWRKDRAAVETFILGLAACIREGNDYEEHEGREKQDVPVKQLNVIRLLANISVTINKLEVINMIFPMFMESLEVGDASAPSLLRPQILNAVSRIACLGFEKSYRETVVLMTRSYLNKISTIGSLAPDATTERAETLPAGFLLIAGGIKNPELRLNYRHRLLSLCSDVGIAAESKCGSSGADSLGPLLPAVAEICSDFDPTADVEPSLLKLFRNLWFYIALFGLAPPIHKNTTKSSMSAMALQAVGGPYMYNPQWCIAVKLIAQATPPLVVSSAKWLEDELELTALKNPCNLRDSGNETAAVIQRADLSAALGGKVEVAALSSITGVKATYLLAVALLEIIRFSSNGGILNGENNVTAARSAFSCIFEYLKSPNLTPDVFQCLTAIVHKAFATLVSWLEERLSETGNEAEIRDATLSAHTCFLINCMSQRQEHLRDISVSLLSQLKDRFPQVLWNSSCWDSLIFPTALVNDPASVATVHSLYQKVLREWITSSLSYAPCTSQGLLQEKLCKANTQEKTQHNADVVSLLSEIRIRTGKYNGWIGIRAANVPAVMAAAAAASGGANLRLTGALSFEKLSTGFNEMFLQKFVLQLQQFVSTAEKGEAVDKSLFREACSGATALLLSNLGSDSRSNLEGFSQIIRLLCWCPAYISTPDAMETGIYIWTWLVSAAPQLGSLVLAELVDAWLWTVDMKIGLFAYEVGYSGPAAKLRPQLAPGEPEMLPVKDPVEGIFAHRLWLGFFIDRFEVVRHDSIEQLLLLGRMLQGTIKLPSKFSRHPVATGTFFTVMLFGLKFCSCQWKGNLQNSRSGLQFLEDRIYRAALGWFANEPEWFDMSDKNLALSEAQSVSLFVHHLSNERVDALPSDSSLRENGSSHGFMDQYHPVWGKMDNYTAGREKSKQLLLLLCQHEADRLEVWATPVNTKVNTSFLPKVSSEKWIEYARTAFSVDPRIAFSLVTRFRAVQPLKSEVSRLVQLHIVEIRNIAEALPFFVTPKAVDENSVLLHQLPHWAACSVTQALEFLTPAYKGHPRVMDYVLGVLESYPPERVTFFMPQLVQALRYDDGRLVEGYLLRAAQRSDIFAHTLIWHLQGETCSPEVVVKDPAIVQKNAAFLALLPVVREHIVKGFNPKARDIFEREFDFFDKVTSISGALYPLPKEERRAGIRRELEKIQMNGDDLYLPTAPGKLVRGIQVDSGIPLQSAAKVPIMITFDVIDRNGDPSDVKPQACIFKVGDDCRQDVLALQVISLLRDIFEAVGLNLYVFPYGVLPTGPERGIIEVVPNTRSRSQMGETTDGGLYEIFQQEFGTVGSPSFEAARDNFIISAAGYAVASLLLQPKDRHNGNLLFDNIGRLVHIDFGFIFEISPGGNMRFESAHFKLSHEMTQLLDPSGDMKSETWNRFLSLCVKGYLAARRHMDGIINTVVMMLDSGLPCFSRGDPVGNLRKRFHPEMTEREAANFMIRTCVDAYNKWSTAGYDLIQYLQQGVEK